MYLGHFFPVKFQHTAARRRLHTNKFVSIKKWKFQHTAARRRLPITFTVGAEGLMFQHTAARRRLQQISLKLTPDVAVSTHSRPKAAAGVDLDKAVSSFVSTHSRPKAAALFFFLLLCYVSSFNTQPPEGGCTQSIVYGCCPHCFNTQPPEGGCSLYKKMIKISKLFTVFRYPLKYKEYQEV